jgi:hypothetical protein
LRAAYSDLADCYAAAGQLNDATQAMQAALDSYQKVATRRALRADEEETRKTGLAKLALWKTK